MPKPPPARQIRSAREAAGLSRSAAAALIYKSMRAWEKWEQGDRAMDPALWELWRIKVHSSGE
jgi:DNA-binding transcriptional regulator YiaG